MATKTTVRVRPAIEPTTAAPPVTIEVTYETSAGKRGADAEVEVTRSARFVLDNKFHGEIELPDVASASVRLSALAVDGASLASSTQPVAADSTVTWVLEAGDLATLMAGGQQIPTDQVATTVTRSARLVSTGGPAIDFGRATAAVAAVATKSELDATGLEVLLATQQGTRVSTLEVTGQSLSALTRMAWRPAHVGVDGTLQATFEQASTVGWIWWLIGEHQLVGFVPDDLSKPNTSGVLISLPAVSSGLSSPAVPAGTPVGPTGAGSATPGCDCDRIVPTNVTEVELAENPHIYAEDPGSFCRPFSNPERVLSEKAFSVVARVTQPDIGAIGSSHLRSLNVLQLDGDGPLSRPPQAPRPMASRGRFLSRLRPASPASLDAALTAPIARIAADVLPSRHLLLERYSDLLNRLPAGRRAMDATHPMQWEDDIAQYQAATVALGHILEFRVRWRSNGYSLGTVAKTLTLAPRQTKRIQKIEWQRTERARRTERTQLFDQENDSVVRERDFNDSVAANLNEWASGGSSSDTEAVAGGIGFAIPGLIGGIGGGAGSAHSSSHQEGGRSTTASEQQRLRDSIRRHGDALRKFESTVVNEVTQAETVTGTTEVIRNPNYAHSLTVIYYQILRHLKVTTDFGRVRECLFVPFAVKPFDIQRAYRWRESIQAYVRSPRYSRALRYLRDVATNFATSDIVAGPRANQGLTFIRGSIYVSLAVERPRDTADGKFDSALWQVAQPLLDVPAFGIFSGLAALVAEQRDRLFQAEHAPGMAARWADRIDLQLSDGRTLHADCTLASRYQFNQVVRIDYSVPSEQLVGLTRQSLTQLRVVPHLSLPPGSVANLVRASITYNTDRFEHSVEGRTGTNDLVKPITGLADRAVIALPLDEWERVDERLELRRAVEELVAHLNEHVEYYHKAIWWRMDRDRLLMMLDGFYVPNTNDVSIASVVDREPVAVIGNCLVYAVGAASFLGYGKVDTPAALHNLYADRQPVSDPLLVSLPTDGLYAQTIMDECAALEEHFGNTDWVLNDPDPDLGTIDPILLASRRADNTAATTPTPFPGTIINLQNAPEAPAPQGFAGILGAVTNANAFRDMAGLAGTQANARAALETAAGLATNFGNQAAALELAKLAKAEQGTRSADQKLASIKKAKDAGLTSEGEAAAQTTSVLNAMNPDGGSAEAPHANPAINAAIDTAKNVPGSTIEAATGEGTTRVTIGQDKADNRRGPFIVEVKASRALRCFEPGTNMTGKTKLSVRGSGLPAGADLRWSIPSSETGKYTITQSTVGGVSEVEISGIRPGISAIDVEARDGTTVLQSIKFPLSIPQFVTIDDNNAQINAFIAANTLTAIDAAIFDEAREVIQLLLLSKANVRLLWKSKGGSVPAHVPASLVTTLSILNADPAGGDLYGVSAAGPSGAGVGDTAFDEVVTIFPGSYLSQAAGVTDVDTATNDLVRVVTSLQASDPEVESWLIRIIGRLIGETISHELYHTLLPVPFNHNVDGSNNAVDTRDLMDDGSKRSFLERTGIVALSSLPADFLANLTDNGRASINGLVNPTHLTHINTHFPIPPTPPFDK